MYLPPDLRPHRRRWHIAHSWIVVGIAPVSLGLLTFAAFWYAAARMRSKTVALCAAGYTGATVLEFNWAGPGGDTAAPGFGWMLAITLVVGTGHLIAIQRGLARALAADVAPDPRWNLPPQPGPPATGWATALAPAPGTANLLEQDPVYRQVVTSRARREQARALVRDNPGLADELGVGRPDLGRGFDDGGLIDVNAVPAEVLATLPGFTAALAEDVSSTRQRVGGAFVSAEDLVVRAGVPPELIEQVRDRLLFRPA